MFYLITIMLGWISVNFIINLIQALLSLDIPLNHYFFIYVMIGYFVMSQQKIVSPLFQNSATGNPFTSLKRIEYKLFFKDLYYACWWPYYLLRKKQ